MARRFPQFSLRFALEATFVLAAGLAGYQAVYVGEANRWPGFQLREGYWGTQFLSSVLYAIGSDRVVLRIVSGTWFGYAALIAVGLVVVGRLCVRPGRTTSPGCNTDSRLA